MDATIAQFNLNPQKSNTTVRHSVRPLKTSASLVRESIKMTFQLCFLARYFSAFLQMLLVSVMFEINKKQATVQSTIYMH